MSSGLEGVDLTMKKIIHIGYSADEMLKLVIATHPGALVAKPMNVSVDTWEVQINCNGVVDFRYISLPASKGSIRGYVADEWYIHPSVTDPEVLLEVSHCRVFSNQKKMGKARLVVPETNGESTVNICTPVLECKCSSKSLASFGHEPGCEYNNNK